MTACYAELGARTVRRPRITVVVAVAFVSGAVGLVTCIGSEFLPQLDEGVIWVRANLPPGTSLAKSAEIANDMSGLIRQSSEVKDVASQTGRNDSGTDPFGPNRNELLITLRPYDEWRGKKKLQLVEELNTRLRANTPRR